MGLEDLTGPSVFINSFNKINPSGSDPKNEGDDHLRGIKNVLQNTFPSVNGALTADVAEFNVLDGLTATTAELNSLDGYTGVTADLNLLSGLVAASMGVMTGDADQKIWVYRNSAMTGWVIDSSVQDVVLAAKGGSTYGTAGTTAGSWVVGGVGAHSHQWHQTAPASTDDMSYNSGGGDVAFTRSVQGVNNSGGYVSSLGISSTASGDYRLSIGVDLYTSKTSFSQDGTWRIAAAVNTLQYLDI